MLRERSPSPAAGRWHPDLPLHPQRRAVRAGGLARISQRGRNALALLPRRLPVRPGRAPPADGQVLGAEGAALAEAKVELQERTQTGFPGLDKLLANFDPEALPPGEYTLEVALGGGEGSPTWSRIPFVID